MRNALGLLNLFSGPSPEKLEQKGDALLAARLWGKAKLESEHALEKLEKSPPRNQTHQIRIRDKIIQAKEALALEHHQHAAEMMDTDCYDEAREMVILALEHYSVTTLLFPVAIASSCMLVTLLISYRRFLLRPKS